jgi:aspartate kinase
MEAEVCEIYTDVAGVFSPTRGSCPDARKLPGRLVRGDARDVGSGRRRAAAALGRSTPANHGVRIHCRSSFTEEPGTFVSRKKRRRWNAADHRVTHSSDEARVTLLGVPDHAGHRRAASSRRSPTRTSTST